MWFFLKIEHILGDKFIYKTGESTWVILKTLNQKDYYYCTYHDIRVARMVRDLLVEDEWVVKENLYDYAVIAKRLLNIPFEEGEI